MFIKVLISWLKKYFVKYMLKYQQSLTSGSMCLGIPVIGHNIELHESFIIKLIDSFYLI